MVAEIVLTQAELSYWTTPCPISALMWVDMLPTKLHQSFQHFHRDESNSKTQVFWICNEVISECLQILLCGFTVASVQSKSTYEHCDCVGSHSQLWFYFDHPHRVFMPFPQTSLFDTNKISRLTHLLSISFRGWTLCSCYVFLCFIPEN